jgi:hypothetical protein
MRSIFLDVRSQNSLLSEHEDSAAFHLHDALRPCAAAAVRLSAHINPSHPTCLFFFFLHMGAVTFYDQIS